MFQATRFGIGCRNANSFEMHGSGGMLRFNLERLNNLEFADANEAATDQGTKRHPRHRHATPGLPALLAPGPHHQYEHTFIAALGEFLEALEKDAPFHPDFDDGLAVQKILAALQQSARSGQWTTIVN